MIFAIPYPQLDPIAFTLGPLAIRWYALAYIAGLVTGWRYCVTLARKAPAVLTVPQLDDLLVWVTFGVILGGRIGYVLVYKPGYYLENPLQALEVWHGGMSFHGGCLGVFVALYLFARKHGLSVLGIGDIVACAVPIGLFFGRLANFVNGELWGRPSDVPWAMVFPDDPDHLARHPSQLYQAALEGVVLFVVLTVLERRGLRHRRGLLTGAFLAGYAVARATGELFRQPDVQLGFIGDFLVQIGAPAVLHPLTVLLSGVTMGQILCVPMLIIGIWLIRRARPSPA